MDSVAEKEKIVAVKRKMLKGVSCLRAISPKKMIKSRKSGRKEMALASARLSNDNLLIQVIEPLIHRYSADKFSFSPMGRVFSAQTQAFFRVSWQYGGGQ